MSSNKTFNDSEFVERIATVRTRFASKLADQIRATDAALAHLANDGSTAVDAVDAAYRRFHDMYGIGATIGFKATGHAARALDAVLIGPFRERRGLRGDELAKLTEALEALRIAALTEMQLKDWVQEFKP